MSYRCGWDVACARLLAGVALLIVGAGALAQIPGQPPEGAACVVTAGNRNAPLAADGTYTVFGIPGDAGAIRARVTCSDGSVGQSAVGFTDPNSSVVVELGPIVFGQLDPVPLAVTLSAPSDRLSTGESAQMRLMAVAADGSVRDVTPRSEGTTYSISNDLMATVSDDGLVQVYPQFAAGSSARVVAGAVSEGAAASSFMFVLGPRGRLEGRVLRADGVTGVEGAQVAVMRLQPVEQAGVTVTDASGAFAIDEVNAGSFLVSAIEPSTGDRALAIARIENEGQTAAVQLRLNGLGAVEVTVRDAQDQVVPNALVTYTALGAFRTSRTQETGPDGRVVFAGVPAGDLTVSTRDPATRLIGTAVSRVSVGQTLPLVLRLQPIGEIEGRVLDVDGATPVVGVQVRLLSRERGILTQTLSGPDGGFAFDTLPISDGPYTLDAFVSGRLRARVPGLVLPQPNAVLERDIVFGPVGVVRGQVRGPSGNVHPDARVLLQTMEGLRLDFDVLADAQGRYVVPAVPVGDFELTATTSGGRTGRAAGRVDADAQVVERDVVVVEDTLVGTVYQRDGVTPVGAGVAVYLAPRSIGLHYSLSDHPQAIATETDAQGRYGFTVPRADVFVVQAEQGLERARTQVVVVNLNPSQPLIADMAFLPKGTVVGQVSDAGGAPQVDVAVTVRSEGAFVAERETRTDASGRYVMPGVFAGDVAVSATNELTQLSGVARGRLDAEGQQITVDVMLAATGTVEGQVLRRDGTVVPGAVSIELRRNGVRLETREFADGGSYRFEFVPLGDIELRAQEIANGDRGLATTRISSAGDLKQVPVRLVGQADLEVTLEDESGAPVAGARVVATQSTPFPLNRELYSDAQGRVVFERLYAGDFQVSATKPAPVGQMAGSASGTLLPGVNQAITIEMVARAFGRIEGVVLAPDGVTPVGAGKVVRMLPEPFRDAFVTQTDADGRYAFEPVDAGTYTVDVLNFYAPSSGACPDRDRVRGRATGVTLSTQGQVVQADVQLIGAGSVSGTVVDANDLPVAGVEIRLTNPDPLYGANVTCSGRTTWDTSTDAAGNYALVDVPPGDFTITASNPTRTLRAEGFGRVRFDGDAVSVDLVLVDSAVTMPQVFHDANGFRVDVQGNGSIGSGTNNVFAPPAPDNAGMRLEIVRDGIAVPFTNGDGSIGRIDESGEQVEVDDITPSGLFVTRRILTPRAGYFARYLEILENPGDEPITVDVRVRSHHRPANSNPRVVDTSDGDQILSVLSPTAPDRWAVIDDQLDADPFTSGSIPATGHLFDGPDAALRVAAASYELIGTTGRLTYRWNGVTVPPGGRAILMHFAFHQIDREAAREAALRLQQLPPEAIDDLTTDERADVRNFEVPEVSPLEALPNLDAGIVEGRVLSGDGETPVDGARVRFKSRHVLFGRERFLTTQEDGAFRFRSTLNGTVNNYVIPVYAFELSASYARSGASSSLAQGDFDPGQTRETQDIIFATTGNVRGAVLRHNGATVAAADVRLCRLPDRAQCSPEPPNPSNSTTSAPDGGYLMVASQPRDYFLFAAKAHPQNPPGSGARPIYGNGEVTVTAGDTSVANITMEPTGSIAGVVRAADGTPVVGAGVELWLGPNGVQGRARYATTDTAGFYRLFDVPLGTHQLLARDASSGAEGVADASVSVDIETERDITLEGFGALRVQVEFARGTPAGGSHVVASTLGAQTADSNGRAQFQAAVGTYTLRAHHPEFDDPNLRTSVQAEVETAGQQVDVLIVLKPAGAVGGSIVRPDGTTLAGGFPYTIRQIRGSGASQRSGNTSAAGTYRVPGLPLGGYVITAYDATQDRFADAEFDITEDGQEVELDLELLANRIALPATLRDANRFAFDVQHSGALATGDGAFAGAGALLEVNGQAYVGETSARLEAGRRQFAIAQPQAIDGLQVSRRIYVPRGAYSARYVETLENPTAAPISASIRVTSNFADGLVRATSSGDAAVTAADRWVLVDDQADDDIRLVGGMPATVHLFAGEGGEAPDSVTFDFPAERPRLRAEWQNVEVPAGGRVSLVHFMVQQIRRSGAVASVERLAGLPPEAISDPPEALADGALNFVWPADGTSSIEPLPALTASVSGIAYEGDVRTPVRNARVTVQSAHPIFSRVWGKHRNPDPFCPPGTPVTSLVSLAASPGGVSNPPLPGSFSLQGQLTADDSIALPQGVEVRLVAQEPTPCFGYFAGHPFTRVASRTEVFPASDTRSLIWDTGILTGSVVGTIDFSVTGGRLYRSIDDPDPPYPVYVPIGADATWVYPGLLPGRYDLLFDTSHPQGSGSTGGLLRGQRTGVDVTLGAITVTDVSMQPTGALQGTVLTANGEASRDARVILEGAAIDQIYDQCASGCDAQTLDKHKGKRLVRREVRTDTLGRYSFAAVPAGGYSLSVIDPVSEARTTLPVDISADQTTVQNVVLHALGSIQVEVRKSSGAAAVDALVYLTAQHVGSERVAGRTDSLGRLTVANVPVGTYTLRVRDPRHQNVAFMDRTASGSIDAGGEIDTQQLTLRVGATLQIDVVDGDNAGQAVAGAQVWVRDSNGERRVADTNAQGRSTAVPVVDGTYTVRVRATLNGVPKEEQVQGSLSAADDEAVRAVSVDLRSALIPLPQTLYDANREAYRIEADAGSSQLPRLRINDVAFTGTTPVPRQLGGRQYSIEQPTALSGLTVTRRVHVPRNGYAARYLEVLENRGGVDVSVDVEVQSRVSYQWEVRATSSGDAVLDSGGATPDRWFSLGPASSESEHWAFVASAADGALPAPQLSYSPRVGFEDRIASARWTAITVPAGGRVVLMHFLVQQRIRNAATVAATRLSELPPEALEGLSGDDAGAIANFALPADGVSLVEPLPELEGRVSGRVLEGDGSTTVASAQVFVRSQHPLFVREWSGGTLLSGSAGEFVLQGVVRDDAQTIALPIGHDVTIRAVHPQTSLARTVDAAYPPGEPALVQDVVFESAAVHGAVTGAFQSPPQGGWVSAYQGVSLRAQSVIGSDGRYALGGLAAGTYRLSASYSVPGGTALGGEVSDVALALGERREQDIALAPNGALSGRVFDAAGTPRANIQVRLDDAGQTYHRSTSTDSQGRYGINAVPAGTYDVAATDSTTGARVVAAVSIAADQTTTQDMVLLGRGQVTATLRYARGIPVSGRWIEVRSPSIVGSTSHGPTDAAGRRTMPISVGAYTLISNHPQTSEPGQVQGEVLADGEASSIELILPASAVLRVRLVDAEQGDAPMAGIQVRYTAASTGSTSFSSPTDADGWTQLPALRQTTYALLAFAPDGRRAQGSFTVDASVDGQVVEQTLAVQAGDETEGEFTFPQARHLYSVEAQAGDVLATTIRAVADCDVRVQVYSPTHALLAAGYGRGPSWSYSQINEQGDLRNVVAPTAGWYTLAVSPRTTSCFATGYRLSVAVNGEGRPLLPYHNGATVRGRVYMPDGITPAVEALLRLRVTSGLRAGVELRTDALGFYEFANLPLGQFVLDYIPPPDSQRRATAAGYLNLPGEVVDRDLVLSAVTTINARIFEADGQPMGSGVQVGFLPADGSGNAYLWTNAEGRVSYTYLGNAPLAVRAWHPTVSSLWTETLTAPLDGGTREVEVRFLRGSVQGRVLDPDAATVAHAYVALELARNGEGLRYAQADAAGQFSFADVPAELDLRLRVEDPRNSVVSRVDVRAQAGQSVTQDIVLLGRGAIHGRVLGDDGVPISDAYYEFRFLTDEDQGWQNARSGWSDADGSYRAEDLPIGRPIDAYVSVYVGGQSYSQEDVLQLDAHGDELEHDVVFELPGGNLEVRVEGSDNLPASGECYLYLWFQGGGGESGGEGGGGITLSEPCDAPLRFSGLAPGMYTLSGQAGNLELEQREVQIEDEQTTLETYRYAVVRGTISYHDAAPADDAYVEVNDVQSRWYSGETDDLGRYRVLGPAEGEVSMYVQDNRSGLYIEHSATLVDAEVPLTVDLVFEPTGLIEGSVLDDQGEPVANAEVHAVITQSGFERTTWTDTLGAFGFDRVPVTELGLTAIHPESGLVAAQDAAVTAPDQIVDVTLQFPAPASVGGTVTLPGGTPAVGVCVEIRSTEAGLGYSSFFRSTYTQADGSYSFASVVPGRFEVLATGCGVAAGAAVHVGDAPAGSVQTVDLELGSALQTGTAVLTDSVSGYDHRVTYPLALLAYRGVSPANTTYSRGFELFLNWQGFPYAYAAESRMAGREFGFSAQSFSGGLRAARRLWVPASSGYARWFDQITNEGSETVEVNVVYAGWYPSWSLLLPVTPGDSGGRYAVQAPSNPGASDAPGVAGSVFAGVGALVPTETSVLPGNAYYQWSWTLTLPPGATRAFLHYAVSRAANDVASAQSQAEALSQGAEPGMFDGLSSEERAAVINFVVPQ